MSKPATSAHLRWGTAPLIPADLTEPDTTHKDEGWQDTEEPPHSFFNYWMNLVYLWVVYLDNLTSEALTWTALETFNAGTVVAGRAGTGAGGSGGLGSAITGGGLNGSTNTSGAAGAGAQIIGGDISSDANGRRGGTGLTVRGGQGQAGYGTAINVTQGDVNLATGNLHLFGGDAFFSNDLNVTANSALSGDLGVAGNSALAGTLGVTGNTTLTTATVSGLLTVLDNLAVALAVTANTVNAFNAVISGALTVAGNTHLTGTLAVHGAATFDANAQAASLTATGTGSSIPAPAATNVTVFSGTFAAGATPLAVWKDSHGEVHLQGYAGSGGTGLTVGTLPINFRPSAACSFIVGTSITGAHLRVDIATTGVITLEASSANANIFFDGVAFRP